MKQKKRKGFAKVYDIYLGSLTVVCLFHLTLFDNDENAKITIIKCKYNLLDFCNFRSMAANQRAKKPNSKKVIKNYKQV